VGEKKCFINAAIDGSKMERGWVISLDGETIQVDEISEDKLEEMNREGVGFLSVECIAVVGMINGKLVDPQRPDSDPWYVMKVVGCYPNLIIYDGKDSAYYISGGVGTESVVELDKLTKGEPANFNKKQFDDAIQEFIDG